MPGQAICQERPASGEAGRQRAFRTAKLPGGLLVGLAFQVAKDDRRPIDFGQATQLLAEQRLQIFSQSFGSTAGSVMTATRLFLNPQRSDGFRPGFEGGVVGNAVEPVSQHLPRLDRRRFAEQHQEGGLKSVLGIVMPAQDATADAPDHGAMTAHQGFESCVFPAGDETLQQLAIGQAGPVAQQGAAAKDLHHPVQLAGWHAACPFGTGLLVLYLLFLGGWRFLALFWRI